MRYTIDSAPDNRTLVIKTSKPAFYSLISIPDIESIATVDANTYRVILFSDSDRGSVLREINTVLRSK